MAPDDPAVVSAIDLVRQELVRWARNIYELFDKFVGQVCA
jgi:hypothetical protein